MCQFASVLVLRNRVVWGMEDSHEKLIKSEGLRDNSRSPEFVRAEISPPKGNPRAPIAEWKYRTDQDYRPDWYSESEAEIAVRDVLPKIVSARVFMSGEHSVRDGFVYAYDSASVEAHDSACCHAYSDSACSGKLSGNGHVVDMRVSPPRIIVSKGE